MTSAGDTEVNVEEILAQRAVELARPVETETPTGRVALVLLSLGAERYGVEIGYVVGVEPLVELTPIPGAPSPWVGLINVRGTLVPVIDTRIYMGTEETTEPAGTDPRVVLVTDSRVTVGLLADDVSHVSRIPRAEVRPTLGRGRSSGPNVVRGVTTEMVAILDVDAVLSEASRVVEDAPAAGEGE